MAPAAAPNSAVSDVASIPTNLDLYLPPSSPLFTYSPDDNFTGTWKGVAGSGVSVPNPAENSSTSGPGWGAAAGSSDTASSVSIGNVKQTAGNAALMLNSVYFTSFTPQFISSPIYTPFLQNENWQSNKTFSQAFSSSTLTISIPCVDPATCASTPFTFSGAILGTEVSPPGGGEAKSVIADDASGLIKYTGWSPAGTNNQVIMPGAGDYGGTLSMTATGNATAMVKFRGTGVLIRGVTASPLGSFSINLNDLPPQTYSSKDEVTTHDVPLFFASVLDGATVHQLSLTTIDGGEAGTGAVLDRVEVWGQEGAVGFIDESGALIVPDVSPIIPPNPGGFGGGGGGGGGNGTDTGGTLPGATSGGAPSAGAIVGILFGVLAALILLYYFFRKYGRPAIAKPAANNVNKWDAANNLQAMKQEAVLVTTVSEQRYVYPGMIAYSDLKKK